MIVLGTRPELVKLAPLIRLLGEQSYVVNTGQHYSGSLYRRVLDSLRLNCRLRNLAVGPGRRGSQLGVATAALDQIIAREEPDVIVVQGDTTSALAGALAANANNVPLVHVEAGLRSYDRAMPEEHHRVLIDHLADMCCAPTTLAQRNLLVEGVAGERVTVTGNTVVEALIDALPPVEECHVLLERLSLTPDEYILATFHRPENVDVADILEVILSALGGLPFPVVLPLHPRTSQRIVAFGLDHLTAEMRVIEPLGYGDFLALTRFAAMVVSDSGGIQEEVSVLKRPIVVVRRSTERPEILGSFGVLITPDFHLGTNIAEWLADITDRRSRLAVLPSPYGDGLASARITTVIRDLIERGHSSRPSTSPPGGDHSSPQEMSRAFR